MSDPVWWSVPQAAAWIRTRDLAALQALDARQAQSLFLASEAISGAVTAARQCLVEALKLGRFAARGRRIDGTVELIPQEFWQEGGQFSDEPDQGVVAGRPGEPTRWIDIAVASEDCSGHWQGPASILEEGAMSLGDVLSELWQEPEDFVAWFLAHHAVAVTGLDGAGQEVPIARRVFEVPFTIDAGNSGLTTGDGRHSWSAVMLELAEPRLATPPRRATYASPATYSAGEVPEQFMAWAKDRRENEVIITVDLAEDALRGPKDRAGNRTGGMLVQGTGLSRETIRAWVKTLPAGWRAVRGEPPSRKERAQRKVG